MSFSRFACLLLILPLLAGCETYTDLRVTNPRGELIANWIARGYIWHIEEGWRITAVERRDGPPYPKTTYYPDGWRTTVVGPYVRHWHCAKPAWLIPPATPPPGRVVREAVRSYMEAYDHERGSR